MGFQAELLKNISDMLENCYLHISELQNPLSVSFREKEKVCKSLIYPICYSSEL